MMVRSLTTLTTAAGAFLGLLDGTDDLGAVDLPETFGVIPLKEERVALRARNGLLVAVPDNADVPFRADAGHVEPRATFAAAPRGSEGFELYTASGQPLRAAVRIGALAAGSK
jgi:hypothetical protein